ncbi:UNVERIFIED_CONTAM: alkylation response protein AidB-like acyl-CoA dehydrogenase [Williamsia faeni]
MLLELTDDQEFFRDTTDRFLSAKVPVAELRRLRDDPIGYPSDYWRQGAELGWTSLLVDESHGGGSISGSGLADLTLVAFEFGRHAAPGPLLPTNVVASLLNTHGSAEHDAVLEELLAGTATAAWALARPNPKSLLAVPAVEITIDGDEVVVHGTKRPVEAAASADYLLVVGRTGEGLSQVLVPRSTAGVTVKPLQSVDLTRRYAAVDFDNVRLPLSALVGEPGQARADVTRGCELAIVISLAESVGAMQSAFDMTLEWAFDRYSFGRALASYQEIKHRFADMKMWLEASHAAADAAAAAVAAQTPNSAEVVSAAKAYIGHYGEELMQDCVQIHGGIGVTFEHDLHLFSRRASANRSTFGTPADHRQRLADIALRQEATV